MYIWGASAGTVVTANRIVNNWGSLGGGSGSGAGIYMMAADPRVLGNKLEANCNQPTTGGRGAAVMQYGGAPLYERNFVRDNRGQATLTLMYSRARLVANRLFDNHSAVGISLESGSGAGTMLANNVVARSGTTAIAAYGFDADSRVTATLIHNTIAGGGSGIGIYAHYANMYVTNTIVASYTTAITDAGIAGAMVAADHNLFWRNGTNGLVGTNSVEGDPAFANPPAGDYHIRAASAAVNRGIPTLVTDDMDGDPRLCFPDIGADEYPAACVVYGTFLPVLMRQ